jgi:hypothetical protein
MSSIPSSVSRFVRATCGVLAWVASHAALAQLPVIQPTQRLQPPPDPAPGGTATAQVQFGWIAAVDGDTAIITVDRGHAAYAYRKNANGRWVYQAALEVPPGGYATFGAAIHGDTALVHGEINSQGAVFVFHRAQGVWTHTQTLPAGFAYPQAHHVDALTGSYAAVGDSSANDCRGGTLIYDKVGAGTYNFSTNLFVSDSQECSFYGVAMAAKGNWVLTYGTGSENIGTFSRDGGVWSEQTQLAYPGSSMIPVFPYDGRRAVLSAATRYENDPLNPIVMLRSNGVWSQEQTLQHPYDLNSKLGVPAAIEGNRIVVQELNALTDNRVFLFERVQGVWTATAELGGNVIQDCGSTNGVPDAQLSIAGNTVIATCPTKVTPDPVFDGRVLVYELQN